MKITDLNSTNGTAKDPCDLSKHYVFFERDGGSAISDYLMQFDFASEKEIESAARLLIRTICHDPYMTQKHLDEHDKESAAVFIRLSRIYHDQTKWETYPTGLATRMWHSTYSRKLLAERTKRMFDVVPDAAKFSAACDKIKRVYHFNDDDIEKLHYFVEQVKDKNFPDTLRRMLYIWSEIKKNGKSTIGGFITAILNGDDEIGDNESGVKNIPDYKSTLSYEMQIESYAVPVVSRCNCVLMDECFFKDMGKVYSQFKDKLTSRNGKARLPYGQEFRWQGVRNYVATSNFSLKTFIKDWDDRRFLCINMRERSEQLSFTEVRDLFKDFILNSTRELDWQEWTNRIFELANESGEMTMLMEEYEEEMKKTSFLQRIIERPTPRTRHSADNHWTTKNFMEMFRESGLVSEVAKQRREIEKAAVNVFGEKYSTSNYWLLTDLQQRAREIRDAKTIEETEKKVEKKVEQTDRADELKDDLPF